MIYYFKILQIFLCIFIIIGILLQYTRTDILSHASVNKEKEHGQANLLENNLSKIIIFLILLFIANNLFINNRLNTGKNNLVNVKYNTDTNQKNKPVDK